MDELNHEYYGKSPYYGESCAYITVEIKRHGTVIPPSGVKESVEDDPCEKFDQRSEYESFNEDHECVVGSYSIINYQDSEHTEPVNRTDRSVKKAPVYYLSFYDCVEYDFDDPSDKGIDYEEPADVVQAKTHT